MKCSILLTVFIFASITIFSQGENDLLRQFEVLKERYESKLELYKDSLESINQRISAERDRIAMEKMTGQPLEIIIPRNCKLYSSPNGGIIKNVTKPIKAIYLDREKRYIKVQFDDQIAYMPEMWLDDKTAQIVNDIENAKFKEQAKINKLEYEEKERERKEREAEIAQARLERELKLERKVDSLRKVKAEKRESLIEALKAREELKITLTDKWNVFPHPTYDPSLSYTIEPGHQVELLNEINGYIQVKSDDGKVVYCMNMFNDLEYKEDDISLSSPEMINIITERADRRNKNNNYGIVINGVGVDNVNSADGVTAFISWKFTDPERTIKYIKFTVVPFNSVGDVQKCSLTGYSERVCSITGPIDSETQKEYGVYIDKWENLWYNSTISCIKITKVSVEYTNGSTVNFVNSLPNIIDKYFRNSCNY